MSAGPIMMRAERWPLTRTRQRLEAPIEAPVFAPKEADHPTRGLPCLGCRLPFHTGDRAVLVPLGPGSDREGRDRARSGQWFNGLAVEVHLACATGRESP